ncbi:hypothetical protein [Lactobacillus apis]|uniref:hypothetical protein n=1 Tax=Lactobacillus apis TaxID=303541 RepID=UPI00242FA1D8|nr:hypothetical protein [Lactobacillus apis]
MKENVVFEYYDEYEFCAFWIVPCKEAVKLLVTIGKISKYGLLVVQEQQWVKKLGQIYLKFVQSMTAIALELFIFLKKKIISYCTWF